MIKLVGVCKEYQVGEDKFFALKDINLTIQAKEYVGILGSSGSGKSTLMHIIGLLDKPTTGQVFIEDKEISQLNDDQLSSLRSTFVGFVFQQFNLINKLTVLENILLPTIYQTTPLPYDVNKKAEELLKKFGILNRKDFYPNKISGGQQQRVAIARALIMSPKLVLADEPTGNLDTVTGSEILRLLTSLNKDFDVTVAIVTHDPMVAEKTKRKIYVKDGQVVAKL